MLLRSFSVSTSTSNLRGTRAQSPPEFQSFLSNGFEEALSGAIKLARYAAYREGRPANGLIVDLDNRVGHFASTSVGESERIQFIPGLYVIDSASDPPATEWNDSRRFGFVVQVGLTAPIVLGDRIRAPIERDRPLVVRCVERKHLSSLRRIGSRDLDLPAPDIVIFDESFVDGAVPFGAFSAKASLYSAWNQSGKAAFHSTTFQPNTVSTLHFMRSLESADPEFFSSVSKELKRLVSDRAFRRATFSALYSPSLTKVIDAVGLDQNDVCATGHYVFARDKRIFDGVAGIACSIRGHNPPAYCRELEELADTDCEQAVATQLEDLTGLPHVLPAVSGALGRRGRASARAGGAAPQKICRRLQRRVWR